MKIKFIAMNTIIRKYDFWMFHFLPVLFIRRDDKFDDKKAYYFGKTYYFGIGWLIFQCYIIIRLPKQRDEETEHVGPATDCQQ